MKRLTCVQGHLFQTQAHPLISDPFLKQEVYPPLHFLLSLFQPLFRRKKNRLSNHGNLGPQPKFTNSISEHGKMVLEFKRIEKDTPLIEVLYNVAAPLFPIPLDIFCHKRDTRSRSSDTLYGPKTCTATDIKSQQSGKQFSVRELRISRNKIHFKCTGFENLGTNE